MIDTKKTKTNKIMKSKGAGSKRATVKQDEKTSNYNLILSIVLGLFIILLAFQSFQINNLSNQVENGVIKISSSSNSYPISSGSEKSRVPSNIQDLPEMVGGC